MIFNQPLPESAGADFFAWVKPAWRTAGLRTGIELRGALVRSVILRRKGEESFSTRRIRGVGEKILRCAQDDIGGGLPCGAERPAGRSLRGRGETGGERVFKLDAVYIIKTREAGRGGGDGRATTWGRPYGVGATIYSGTGGRPGGLCPRIS